MTNLRDSMRLEAIEQTEKAKQRFADAKDKMISNMEGFSESTRQKVRRVSTTLRKSFIGTKKEANDSGIFSGDYDYIDTGYRVNHNSYESLIKSLFTWHNETINVWSHLLGVILFAFLCIVLMVWFEPR